MREETGGLVHGVFRYGLDLKDRLARGDRPALATEQAMLLRLIEGSPEAKGPADPTAAAEVRYALVCWLDELFVDETDWGARWNERKLEVTLFGTNDRAWRFWEQARQAATRNDPDALEVFYLCVQLGFRGELRGDRDRLAAWAAVARGQIEQAAGQAWAPPPELDPPASVPPLRGRDMFQTMALRAAVVLLLVIPVTAFFAVLLIGQRG
jgi:type VI secretion system protein ImpK